jgi:hypothetical protein
MPFAAVTYVSLEGRDPALAEKMLSEVLIPRLKGLSGFRGARFMRSQDRKTGIGSVIFDTESNAKAGLEAMTTNRPAEAPPIESSATYEVFMEV